MDVLGKLDRHVMALKELRAENGPGLWEAHADASLAGSEWCSAGALEVKGSHLRTVSHCPQGSLLLLMRPLGGLVKGTHGWSVREASKDHICSDGVGLPERLSHICNTDIAAKEVALLMAGALDRVQHPQALLLCSPRVQLLPLLGQRLESFFRAFGTLGPSLVDGIVEDHRIKLRPSSYWVASKELNLSYYDKKSPYYLLYTHIMATCFNFFSSSPGCAVDSCGIFPALALLPDT